MKDLQTTQEAITSKTKLIWLETPTNPMMNIIDIHQLVQLSKSVKAMVCVDNTFASPYLQNPLDLGADIVFHSVTKYISGHSDIIMGALISNDPEVDKKLGFFQNSTGAIPSPNDCFLALRGIKTLHVRMKQHCANAKKIAFFLKNHPLVKNVFWPGFTDHPNHKIAVKQMKDFGGIISFTMQDERLETSFRIMKKLKIFSLAESLGGVESLVCHPATMTHASIPKTQRLQSGLTDSLIRLSVGIEDAEDLLADIEQALS